MNLPSRKRPFQIVKYVSEIFCSMSLASRHYVEDTLKAFDDFENKHKIV